MTPAEELELLELEAEALRKKAPLPPQGKSVLGRSAEMESFRPNWADKSQAPGMGEELYGGAKHALQRSVQGLAGLVGQEAVSPETLAAGKAFVDETGPASSVGQFGTDAATFLLPGTGIAKGGLALKAALAARNAPKLAAAAAPLATGIAGNAGVSAALAPEDRGTAAAWGAGGEAGGRLLARTLGGPLKQMMTPEARKLAEAGVQLTPGQMVSGANPTLTGRIVRSTEDMLSGIPLVGDIIRHGKANAVKSWNINEINQALAPIGAKVKQAGTEGIDEAADLVSKSYDSILPAITIPEANVKAAIKDAEAAAKNANPLFDEGHADKLSMFINRKLRPMLQYSEVSGEVAKRLDAEMGELARKYKHGGVSNEPLGDAFEMLRTRWRSAMVGQTPEAREGLKSAEAAFAKLIAMRTASETTNTGVVTPAKWRQVTAKLRHTPTETSMAARQVLPDTLPDEGTASRLILHNAMTPAAGAGTAAAASMFGGMGLPAALAAGAAAMYTRPGARYLSSGGEDILNATLRMLRKGPMTPQKLQQMEEITRVLSGTGIRAAGPQGE